MNFSIKTNDSKAAVLRTVMFLIGFAVIVIGVALEANMPAGFLNSMWAFSIVIPATGLFLSLVNWNFVKMYKSRKIFSYSSMLITLGITACAYIWGGFHYEFSIFDFAEMLQGIGFVDFIEMIIAINIINGFGIGMLLTLVGCIVSKVMSNKYAKLLGIEA